MPAPEREYYEDLFDRLRTDATGFEGIHREQIEFDEETLPYVALESYAGFVVGQLREIAQNPAVGTHIRKSVQRALSVLEDAMDRDNEELFTLVAAAFVEHVYAYVPNRSEFRDMLPDNLQRQWDVIANSA